MVKNNIKTTRFTLVKNQTDFLEHLQKFNYQAILKTNQMGYDGKGQFRIKDQTHIPDINFHKEDYILEEFVPFAKEISVILVEQHLELALRVCSYTYVLDRGKVALRDLLKMCVKILNCLGF